MSESQVGERSAGRIDAIDWLRGAVMVLMALDHVREFFWFGLVNPQNPATASPALFFTRWITHFCAPTFVLLAGAGAYLYGARGRARSALAWFLLSRGVWLVLLEFTIVRWSSLFNFDYRFTFGQVIWAIGGSMVLLSGLVWLPTGVIGVIGAAIIATHNLLDGVSAEQVGAPEWLWTLLFRQKSIVIAPGYVYFNVYPLWAWFGVLCAGYGLGPILQLDRGRRRLILLGLGVALTAAFVALRALHLYGDPRPWTVQKDSLRTVMAFLACTKYPPSLQFLLMTLGPALIVLAAVDRRSGPPFKPLITYGRVPLFYYLLHFPLIHGLAVAWAWQRYGRTDWLFANPGLFSPRPPFDGGMSLPGVYLVWILVVVALYWPCKWFAGVKRRHPGGWRSYL